MKRFFVMSLFLLISTFTAAEESVNYSFGIKDWMHIMRAPLGAAMASNGTVVSGSAKYKEYSVSASTLLLTTYALDYGSTMVQRLDRDIAIGYTPYEKYTFFVGYKDIETKNVINATGIFYGVSSSYSFGSAGYIHGTFAMSNAINGIDGVNQDGSYRSVEFGYGYPLNQGTVLGIGYRQQHLVSPLNTEYNIGGVIFGLSVNF